VGEGAEVPYGAGPALRERAVETPGRALTDRPHLGGDRRRELERAATGPQQLVRADTDVGGTDVAAAVADEVDEALRGRVVAVGQRDGAGQLDVMLALARREGRREHLGPGL